jgi:aminoglycoside phosphotransferase (APT) family kinase protein
VDEISAAPSAGAVLDVERLAGWMDARGLGSGPVREIVPLAGGTQNVVLHFHRGPREFVLRRPPWHPRAESNQTILREARVLGALNGSAVPHPQMLAVCEDPAVLGTTFYLMPHVAGFNATAGLPERQRASPQLRGQMGFALVEAAAELAAVDHRKVGLDTFGKPEGFLQRQTQRWQKQLDSYGRYANWPGTADIPGIDRAARWLEQNLPESGYRAGILHGDYHIGNVLYCYDSPRLAAILDWELATIGDPLLDLAWLVATWPDEAGFLPNPAMRVQPWDGFPSSTELIAHYARCSGRDLRAMAWYVVLACFKLGIILEGTHARACAGEASMETGERLHVATQRLFQRAMQWIDKG